MRHATKAASTFNRIKGAINPSLATFGLLVVLLVAVVPASSKPAGCERQLEAPPHVYLGGWVPGALDDPRLRLAQDPLGETNALIGKPLAIVNRWEHWGLENDGGVDEAWMRRVAAAGAIPMYTWDPWNPERKRQTSSKGSWPATSPQAAMMPTSLLRQTSWPPGMAPFSCASPRR